MFRSAISSEDREEHENTNKPKTANIKESRICEQAVIDLSYIRFEKETVKA